MKRRDNFLNYKVINEPWFCRRKDKPNKNYICYRSVISHILFQSFKNEGDSFCKKLFEDINKHLSKSEDFIQDGYIELHSISNKGYVLIDKTKGTFPLIFYSEKKSDNSGARMNALNKSIKDLGDEEVFAEILYVISRYKEAEWCEDLQNQLQDIYTYRCDENK